MKRIFLPLNADGVGVFDPSDNSFALVDISSTISTDFKFAGAATASNGQVLSPYDRMAMGVFDPTDNSFALVDISSTISTDVKFSGLRLRATARSSLRPMPRMAGVFEDRQQLLPGGHQLDHLYRLQIPGAATASNGKIIFVPNDADAVGVFQAVHPPCDASTAPTNGNGQLHQLIG